jgi:NAD-dependent deacetylase
MHSVTPNDGHYALAEMEKLYPDFHLITQNIDNLHFRAGNKNIIELHGNIERNYCIECRKFYKNISVEQKSVIKCKDCGGLIRPDVVWFGEMLPAAALNEAQSWSNCADVFFTIGTAAEVYPAAMLPLIAQQAGAYVIEINTKPTNISADVNEVLQGKSGEILKQLVEVLKERKN